jgi:hypothetical protein
MALSCGETADKATNIFNTSPGNGGVVNFSGYVYDVTTGATITAGYTITAETADKTITGSLSTSADTAGKFTLSRIPLNSDYIIRVAMAGYRTFVSSHTMESSQSAPSYGSVDAIRNVGLVPLTVAHPAIAVSLVNDETGAPLSAITGLYRLDRDASVINELGIGTSGSLGTADGGIDAWTSDSVPLVGTVSGGSFTIAAGVLDYGYNYTLTVYNCTGYLTGTTAISAFTYTLGSFSNSYTVALAADDHYTSLTLLGVNIGVWSDTATANSIIDANEIVDWLHMGSERQIIFYFNQDIEVSSTWNVEQHGTVTFYKDPGDFVSLDTANVENVDNDGTAQTMNDRRLYSNAGFGSVSAGNYIFNLSPYPTNPVTATATVSSIASTSEVVANWQILAPANHVASVTARTPTAGTSNYVIVNNTAQTGATGTTAGSGNGLNVICIPNPAKANIANYDWVGQSGTWARIMSIGADDSCVAGYSNINTNDGSISITWSNSVSFSVNRQIYPTPAGTNYATPNAHRTVATNPAVSTVTVSGNQLIIMLNDDATILRDGSYDADDDLGYIFLNSATTGLGLIQVRVANPATSSPWLQLYGNFVANGVSLTATVRNTVGK